MTVAKLQFRITSINFDTEEEVEGVTATMRDDAYGVIVDILGEVDTLSRERGGTEITIRLSRGRMLDLFRQCRRIPDGYPPPWKIEPGEEDSTDPLTHSVANLITVCRPCHCAIHDHPQWQSG